MEVISKAIKIRGKINSQHQLIIDEPLPVNGPTDVLVIILMQDDLDIKEKEWFHSASINPAFDFLKEPEEDIYTLEDGSPFNDKV